MKLLSLGEVAFFVTEHQRQLLSTPSPKGEVTSTFLPNDNRGLSKVDLSIASVLSKHFPVVISIVNLTDGGKVLRASGYEPHVHVFHHIYTFLTDWTYRSWSRFFPHISSSRSETFKYRDYYISGVLSTLHGFLVENEQLNNLSTSPSDDVVTTSRSRCTSGLSKSSTSRFI